MLNNEKEKLKRALNEYQQFKCEEEERIEKTHREAQWKRREFLKRLFGFLNGLLVLMVFVGIIAVIYNYGLLALVTFILQCLVEAVAVYLCMIIFSLGLILKLPERVWERVVVPLIWIIALVLVIMSYLPSSPFS